jgi:hypothetical protein
VASTTKATLKLLISQHRHIIMVALATSNARFYNLVTRLLREKMKVIGHF